MSISVSNEHVISDACQILREIKFGHFEAQEFFISTILAALNFDLLSICDIFKFTQKSKVKPYKIVKMADFNFLKSTKIDFT